MLSVMPPAGEERGTLLLGVMIHSTRWMLLAWSAIVACAAIGVFQALSKHELEWTFFLVLAPLLVHVLYPRVRFYEGGVEIPPTHKSGCVRFLPWSQVERYSWDGDTLVLVGTTSVLSGGPAQGDTLNIPPSKHLPVEQVLSTKVARR